VRLVVGLGNPGGRYAGTRHNVAWQVLDELARRWRASEVGTTPVYTVRQADVGGDIVALMQPLTFMNNAGDAVEAWQQGPQGPAAELMVVGDDVYLPVGTMRIRARGSSGGHRGLESIERAMGGRDFARLRIGVGAAESSAHLREHVLAGFTADERTQIDETVVKAADAVECWATEGVLAAMNRFNRRTGKEVREP
jgi:peptidyl-tRNA hydrolase, PTH1 family